MSDCPPEDDLSAFLNETLAPEKVGRVSAHVDGCRICQRRLDKLTNDTDGAMARYKELSSVSDTARAKIALPGTVVLGAHAPTRFAGLPSVPGFEVLHEIGRGGMGVVYKARHRRLNRLVALKMVLAGSIADPRVVQRFLYEAEILARVQHPQVVQIYEVDTYQDASGASIPYLAMELLEGGSLADRLHPTNNAKDQAHRDQSKPQVLEPRAAAELMEGIARAVHTAHLQGVIHRDLKPANILFASEDEPRGSGLKTSKTEPLPVGHSPSRDWRSSQLPKVSDFGLAKLTQDAGADLTGSGQAVGTPHYMSPEQAAGNRKIGPEADVYGLGAILYECLTGRPPFEGAEPMSVLLRVVNEEPPNVRSLCRGLHPDLAAVVMRCLAKDPRRRYSSAAEFADDLRRYLDNRSTVARPVTFGERAWRWVRRNPAVAALLAALTVVLAAAYIAITAFWLNAEHKATQERQARDRAISAEFQAHQALEDSNRHRGIAESNETNLEFARAVHWCEEGRVRQGLESFRRAVELAEASRLGEISRAARVNLAAWPRELPQSRPCLKSTYQPRDIAFFPDGNRGVIAARGGQLLLWDTAGDRVLMTFRPSYAHARGIASSVFLNFAFWTTAISADGQTIAAGASDGQIWLWNRDKPEPFAALPAGASDENVWGIVFSPDGTLWSTDGLSGIEQWEVREKKLLARAATPGKARSIIQSLVLASDGKQLFTGNRDGQIQEWNTEKVTPARSWKISGWVTSLALSPGNTHLAATGTGGVVQLIDLATGKQEELGLASAYGKGVAFSPTRPLLVASDSDGTVRAWNWKTGVPVGVPLQLSGEMLAPRFFPGSDEFAIPAGNLVYRCRMAADPGQMLLLNRGQRTRGLDFSLQGERLAVAHDDGLYEFNLANGESIRTQAIVRSPLTIRYDPEAGRNRLFRGLREGFDTVALPTFAQSSLFPTLNRVIHIGFGSGGSQMFLLEVDRISRWDTNSLARPLAQFRDAEMPNGVEHLAMDVRPDGQEVLLAFANKLLFLDAQTLNKSRAAWEAPDDILEAKYLPDGNKILIGQRDSVAQIIDAASGKPLGRPMTHRRAVLATAISPDGRLILTGSRDGTARFWDAASGLPLGPPLRHAGPVTHLGFSPNGTRAATATGDGELMLWQLPPPPVQER